MFVGEMLTSPVRASVRAAPAAAADGTREVELTHSLPELRLQENDASVREDCLFISKS